MPKTSYICNCNVIHEDIVNDVKSKMQPKDDYIQLASLFKLFGDGTRVQILHALEQSEMCVCDLAVLLLSLIHIQMCIRDRDMPIQNIKLIAVAPMNMLQAEIYEYAFVLLGAYSQVQQQSRCV